MRKRVSQIQKTAPSDECSNQLAASWLLAEAKDASERFLCGDCLTVRRDRVVPTVPQ
jgi:hypothetical protein